MRREGKKRVSERSRERKHIHCLNQLLAGNNRLTASLSPSLFFIVFFVELRRSGNNSDTRRKSMGKALHTASAEDSEAIAGATAGSVDRCSLARKDGICATDDHRFLRLHQRRTTHAQAIRHTQGRCDSELLSPLTPAFLFVLPLACIAITFV